MGEDKSGKLHEKENRPVLGNITNQLGKRGFSLISRSPPSKSKSSNSQNADDADSDSNFWKQVSLVVEKLEKERNGTPAKCPKAVNEAGLSPLSGGKTYRLLNTSGDTRKGLPSNVANESKETASSALDSIDLDAVNVGEIVKDGCFLEMKAGESSKCCERDCVEGEKECQGEEVREISESEENDCTHEVLGGTGAASDNGMNPGVECLKTSQSESVVNSRLTETQEMKGFGLERCTALKEDGSGVDLLKHCSCSFCTKAAYIWSDLHYQDVRGRISIMAESQKEAGNLAKKYSAENEVGSHSQENLANVSQIETDLTNHWRSLFLHMEDIFANEGNQLQNNFLELKELREDYKMNLEMINGMPSDVQQCSSDASDRTIV